MAIILKYIKGLDTAAILYHVWYLIAIINEKQLQDFLTGFIADASKSEVYGRPVGVVVANDGALLVADDVSGIIWRVAVKK